MIQKQELRIGNSVMYKGEVWKVEELSDTAAHISQHPLWVRGHYENLEPIPITEEALVKMGFKQIGVGDYVYWIYARIRINKQFELMIDGNLWVEIKYIHQLCNLYYFLTQSELSYEPK